MPESESMKKNQRFSYLKKLIQDDGIPFEELHSLMLTHHHSKSRMSVFVESNNLSSPEFKSEAYLEYRRRVFAELATEQDKESEKAGNTNELICQPKTEQFSKFGSSHDTTFKGTEKNLGEPQPAWDDSDLQAETYTFSPSADTNNLPQQWKANLTNDCNSILMPEQFISQNDNFNHRSQVENFDAFLHSPHIQEQKLEREAVRSRLAFEAESDQENDEFASSCDKPLMSAERTFSANRQSLHICYINDSCSSDESDDEYSRCNRKASISFSPLASPFSSSAKAVDKTHKSLHSSSNTSRNSLDCSSLKSDDFSVRVVPDEARLCQTRRDELELETRFQLAQAQQKAKILAEAEKKIEKLQHRSSLAQRLLNDTLPEETASKLKSYSLTRRDCKLMTIGQLQLVLNDMHSKKQGLNERLVTQLIKRDELQTEQDAKLVDIEDAKAMLDAVGPETTV